MSNSVSIGVAYQDQAIVGGSVDNSPIGASTPAAVTGTLIFATNQLGYATAAEGTVTQATSKSTAVTLNKSAGRITMNAAALASNTNVYFTLNNNLISTNDTIVLNISGGTATSATYNAWVDSLAAGSAVIALRNVSGGSLSEAVILNYAIIHGQ